MIGTRASVAIELTLVGADGCSDALAAVPIRLVGGIGKIDVDAGGAPAAHSTEAVTAETAVGDIVVITVNSAERISNVTIAEATLSSAVRTAELAVHRPSPECVFRAVEVSESLVYGNQ